MPTFTNEDEPDLTIAEDTICRAILEDVKVRTFTWNDRKTGEEKEGTSLDWWWKVTQCPLGPEFIGRKIKGECSTKMTNRDGNKLRAWSEALLHREIPVGMAIDTDDLIGLEADIVVGHRPDRKEPGRIWEFVSDVAPTDATYGEEPPF